ncbi:MAG: S41 family peptidase [Candidatus Sungbacteria bacterium]|nr:S41 family peptidase [Candidatus Sungbacteria bacterium]
MFKFEFEESKYSKLVSIIIVVIVLGTSFFAGVLYGYDNRPGSEKVAGIVGKEAPPNLSSVDFNLFWDVWSRLERKYVDSSKLDREKLMFGAIKGLVSAVGDPHTEFMPPVEAKQFQEDIKGSFDGIGAEIGLRKGVLTVIAPLHDNPAEKAGIKAGDKILKIDDKSTEGLALDEAVRLIRGPHATKVRLLIYRDGFDKPKEFSITRDVIPVKIVETEKKGDGIFVIKLHQFTENAGIEFRKAVQEFYASGSKKLVLDLRNDPGGYLTVSVDIASWFVPAGDVIARERYSNGSEDLYRSNGYGLLEKVPTVVIINEGSASASEILSGALRDLRHIKLIGTKSYGKGSVQEVEDLDKKSSLKVTIAKWLTPNGTEIDGIGLEPDIKVELPATLTEDNMDKDFFMDKALEVLRNTAAAIK